MNNMNHIVNSTKILELTWSLASSSSVCASQGVPWPGENLRRSCLKWSKKRTFLKAAGFLKPVFFLKSKTTFQKTRVWVVFHVNMFIFDAVCITKEDESPMIWGPFTEALRRPKIVMPCWPRCSAVPTLEMWPCAARTTSGASSPWAKRHRWKPEDGWWKLCLTQQCNKVMFWMVENTIRFTIIHVQVQKVLKIFWRMTCSYLFECPKSHKSTGNPRTAFPAAYVYKSGWAALRKPTCHRPRWMPMRMVAIPGGCTATRHPHIEPTCTVAAVVYLLKHPLSGINVVVAKLKVLLPIEASRIWNLFERLILTWNLWSRMVSEMGFIMVVVFNWLATQTADCFTLPVHRENLKIWYWMDWLTTNEYG